MKYTTIALAVFALPVLASAATFNSNLYYGLSGNDVRALQEFLTVQGDYAGPITGNFYSLTLQGVKNFQTRNRIEPVSGYFGVLSRGVANTIETPVAPIEETGVETVDIEVQEPTVIPTVLGSVEPANVPVEEVKVGHLTVTAGENAIQIELGLYARGDSSLSVTDIPNTLTVSSRSRGEKCEADTACSTLIDLVPETNDLGTETYSFTVVSDGVEYRVEIKKDEQIKLY